MFKAFEIVDLLGEMDILYKSNSKQEYLKKGLENYTQCERALEEFIDDDGIIDGTKLQDEWFPGLKADVFISHAHIDKEKVLVLAGWLEKELGLKVFVDSCVWGHVDKLLKKINDEFCKVKNKENTYEYEEAMYAASHVYTMLGVALSKMIDGTECTLFVNTENAIKAKETISKVKSPWIYLELETIRLIKRKQHRPDTVQFESTIIKKAVYESVQIEHSVTKEGLEPITMLQLHKSKKNRQDNIIHGLDALYTVIYGDEYNK